MAGYSGTPLAKKLGLKEGQRIALHGAPEGFLRTLDPLPPGIVWRADLGGTVDGVLLFAPMVAVLEAALVPAATALTPAGMLWVAWPKRAANVPAGLTEDRRHKEHGMTRAGPLRDQLVRLLAWEDAHVEFATAVAKLPPKLRGTRPAVLPYSPWQLVEHLRRTQHDILDFCRNPAYSQPAWPDDYWPETEEPPSSAAWTESLRAFGRDREALQALARDPAIDLMAPIPHGDGQTYLRELLLAADHAAYHLGELIVVRRLLGSWPVDP